MKITLADTVTAAVWTIGRTAVRTLRDNLLYNIPIDETARLMHIALDTAIGRPYGVVRDYLIERYTDEHTGFLAKVGIEGAANATFYAPIYAGVLYWSGADLEQIAVACSLSLGTSMIIGRPYGKSLEFTRKICGVKPFSR